MGRPIKNNAEYFPHDAYMRDHRKIKALRNKFGSKGYAIWCMLLEHLTASDGNEFYYSDFEFEMISGDFGEPVEFVKDVIDYCIKPLELLFNVDGFIRSTSLDQRLEPVYLKRGRMREISEKRKRVVNDTPHIPNEPVPAPTEVPEPTQEEKPEKQPKPKKTDLVFPAHFDNDLFKFQLERWLTYKKERRESYKSNSSINQVIENLNEYSGGNIDVVVAIINKAIGNNHAGLYPLKEVKNGKSTTNEKFAKADSLIDAMYSRKEGG